MRLSGVGYMRGVFQTDLAVSNLIWHIPYEADFPSRGDKRLRKLLSVQHIDVSRAELTPTVAAADWMISSIIKPSCHRVCEGVSGYMHA